MDILQFWPVLIAAVVAYIIGALWYSPLLFGNKWMKLAKITKNDAKNMGASTFIASFIAAIVMYTVLAYLILLANIMTLQSAILLALTLSVGICTLTLYDAVLWAKKPLAQFYIESSRFIVSFVIGAAILVLLL